MNTTLALLFALATQNYNLPAGLIDSVCWVETKHNVRVVHEADGNSASYGVCQVKLETAQTYGFTGTAEDLMHPAINVHFAAKTLKHQLDRYNGDVTKAIAAYNAGRFNPDKKGLPKNKKYVTKVLRMWATL